MKDETTQLNTQMDKYSIKRGNSDYCCGRSGQHPVWGISGIGWNIGGSVQLW